MYESPEIYELGTVDELTLGHPLGDSSDGVPDRLEWSPFYLDSVPDSSESAEKE